MGQVAKKETRRKSLLLLGQRSRERSRERSVTQKWRASLARSQGREEPIRYIV